MLLPPDERTGRPIAIDVPGAATGTAAVTLLVLGCIRGPELGWSAPSVVASLAGAAASLVLFLRVEARSKDPLMPLRLLRHPTLVTAMVVTALFGAAFGAQYYLLTTYLQIVLGFVPATAGLAFLPFALAIVVGTRVGGRLAAAVGLRPGIVGSLLVGVAGQTYLATSLTLGGGYASHVLPGLVIDGIGQGSTWTLMWVAATTGIDAGDRGIASGMASSAQQIGAALGLALLVGVATSVSPRLGELPTEILVRGLRSAFFAAAGMGSVCAAFAFLRMRRR